MKIDTKSSAFFITSSQVMYKVCIALIKPDGVTMILLNSPSAALRGGGNGLCGGDGRRERPTQSAASLLLCSPHIAQLPL